MSAISDPIIPAPTTPIFSNSLNSWLQNQAAVKEAAKGSLA
jgi:hypothetical protein